MTLVADSLFRDHKNGPEILSAISEVQFDMNFIKSKFQTCLTDAHLVDSIRVNLLGYTPDYNALVTECSVKNLIKGKHIVHWKHCVNWVMWMSPLTWTL